MTRARALLFALVVAGVPRGAAAQGVVWTIDPGHSDAQFTVRHMLVSNVTGHFEGPTGAVTFDPNDLSTLRVTASIDATTINTRNRDRDKDLRGPLFFDTAKFPRLTFKSTRTVVLSPERLNVIGDLTMRGMTRAIVLEVEKPSGEVKDIWGTTRIGAVARTTIDRRDFGIVYNRLLEGGGAIVGDSVSITIELELTRNEPKKEER